MVYNPFRKKSDAEIEEEIAGEQVKLEKARVAHEQMEKHEALENKLREIKREESKLRNAKYSNYLHKAGEFSKKALAELKSLKKKNKTRHRKRKHYKHREYYI